MKSLKLKKDKKYDKDRYLIEIGGSTFSRSSRAEEIIKKADKLCSTIRSKRKNDIYEHNDDDDESSSVYNPQNKSTIIQLREDVSSRLRKDDKNTKQSRIYDSVFANELDWKRDLRKLNKRRLSNDIDVIQIPIEETLNNVLDIAKNSITVAAGTNGQQVYPIGSPSFYSSPEKFVKKNLLENPLQNKLKKCSLKEIPLPPIEPLTSSKYFGHEAKSLFFETYRELNKQSNVLVNGTRDIIRSLNSDKSLPEKSSIANLKDDNTAVSDLTSLFDITSVSRKGQKTSNFYIQKELEDWESDQEARLSIQLDSLSTVSSIAATRVIMSSSTYNPTSPRAKFLAGCIQLGLTPLSNIMLRAEQTHTLNLEHQGMGDTMGQLLAAGLNEMPSIKVLNLADNHLTDLSLKPLLDAVSQNTNIIELDLSENKLDEAASLALGTYLSNPNCYIRCLKLKHADVDDSECHDMTERLMNNHTLEELDLSRNLLGKDENLNAVKSETVTAGEALAVLLQYGDSRIKTLKVAWNMIRMEGAVELCASLAYCQYLTHLDLSFNALSTDGGISLGIALHENKSLEKLLISNNGISPAASVAICVGIRECLSLQYVELDGNSIGIQGLRALVSVPLDRADDIVVSTKGCNYNIKELKCWFDYKEPEGIYELDMSDGYERAVMFEMLRLVAYESVYSFISCEYSEDGKNWHKKKLVRFMEKKKILTHSEIDVLQNIENLITISESEDLIKDLYSKYDPEHNGLNKPMFYKLVSSLNLHISQKTVNHFFDIHDYNKSGLLDFEEFSDYVLSYKNHATEQLRDIKRKPCTGEAKDSNLPSERYVPPKKGKFRINIRNTRWRGHHKHAMTPVQMLKLVAFSKQSSDASKVITFGIEAQELYLNEAAMATERLIHDNGNIVLSLLTVLPCVSLEIDAKRLIDINIQQNVTLNRLLKHQMGSLYRPVVGNYTGFYMLDFSKNVDRQCFSKLMERSNENAYQRKLSSLGDISQNGDWSCFRNATYERVKHNINPAMYGVIPNVGKMELDFVDNLRIEYSSMKSISDRTFIEILFHLNFLNPSTVHWAIEKLTTMRRRCEEVRNQIGSCIWHCELPRAIDTGDFLRKTFYTSLHIRRVELEEAIKRERKLKPRKNYTPTDDSDEDDDDQIIDKVNKKKSNTGKKLTPNKTRMSITGKLQTYNFIDDIPMLMISDSYFTAADSSFQRPGHISKAEIVKEIAFAKKIRKFVRTVNRFTENINCELPGISNNIVAFFEDLFGLTYICCRHLAVILECFTYGKAKKSIFGSYHVELIVILFQRIKDLHNFELILAVISAEEHACLFGRLGFLTLFNPVKPEGNIRLHLSCFEQRQIVKMLLHLSLDEPGENWIDETYSSSPDLPPMPGWELSVVWLTDAGLPHFGCLTTCYYSGDGRVGIGYLPNSKLRYALTSLVLTRAEEIVCEYNEDQEPEYRTTPLSKVNEMLSMLDSPVTWTYDFSAPHASALAHIDRKPKSIK